MPEIEAKIVPELLITTYTTEQPGSQNRKNEDVALTLADDQRIAAFIADGGTALSSLTTAPAEKFDGLFAANTAAEGLKKGFSVYDSSISLLLAANDEIGMRLKENGIDPDKTPSEFLPTCGGASLILVKRKIDKTEVSQTGDTAVLVIFKNDTVKVAVNQSINREDIKAYNLAREISKSKHINIKDALNDPRVASMLILGRHKENMPEGYGALNGKSGVLKYVKSRIFKTSEISQIIALTDGMVPPQPRFDGAPDWSEVAKQIINLGPERFYQKKVFEVKESDPELVKFPRFKIHDDATMLGIKFT
jgi:hypothetical protein